MSYKTCDIERFNSKRFFYTRISHTTNHTKYLKLKYLMPKCLINCLKLKDLYPKGFTLEYLIPKSIILKYLTPKCLTKLFNTKRSLSKRFYARTSHTRMSNSKNLIPKMCTNCLILKGFSPIGSKLEYLIQKDLIPKY